MVRICLTIGHVTTPIHGGPTQSVRNQKNHNPRLPERQRTFLQC